MVCQPNELESYGRRRRDANVPLENVAPKGDVIEEIQVESNGLQTYDAQAQALNASNGERFVPCIWKAISQLRCYGGEGFSLKIFGLAVLRSFLGFYYVFNVLHFYFDFLGIGAATGSGSDQVCLSTASFAVTLAITLLLALVAIAISVSCWLMAYRRRPDADDSSYQRTTLNGNGTQYSQRTGGSRSIPRTTIPRRDPDPDY